MKIKDYLTIKPTLVMICFVAALRDTMAHEFNSEKLNFFLHFGAASLVWFNYLPILSLVALQVIFNEFDALFLQLTHYSPLIQPSFSQSKWNMSEILPILA